MTTAVTEQADPRITVLASGVRVVRLQAGDEGWIKEFESILRIAAKDFLQRSGADGTPDGVLQEVSQSLWSPQRAVWFALTEEYRLLGFALAELRASFGAPPELFTIVTYLYPRRTPRDVFPALVHAMLTWGRARGATRGTFQTQRRKPGAWARIGAKPIATVYAIPIAEEAP